LTGSALKVAAVVVDCQKMSGDAFSGLFGDLRGARRPVDEGANDPYVILVREPGCGWHTSLLPKDNELLVNIAELGLDGDGDDVRELVIDVCALLVFALRENPEIDDEELDDLAVHGVKTFRGMTREQRNLS
jgi:hypothetical protein